VAERQEQQSNSINMQTNCDIATIALAKAESEERAEDCSFLALNTQLEAKRLESEIIGKLMAGNDNEEEVEELRSSLRILRGEIRELSVQIAAWTTRVAAPNIFVDNLLSNAESMMGINPAPAVSTTNAVTSDPAPAVSTTNAVTGQSVSTTNAVNSQSSANAN
jgi:hypothetical protein